jgi:lauroyl/myristoyl acyltransferase
MRSLLRRFNVYGDFWPRFLDWGASHCPWYLEPIFLFGFTILFFLGCGSARRSVAANLRVIIPHCSWLGSQLGVLRVFWNFACTIDDESQMRNGSDIITWEIFGLQNLQELESSSRGGILLTAHMGNYDIAAPVFADKFKRTIHMVRSPELQIESQLYQEKQRARQQSQAFVIHYNEPGSMLGVELARCIGEGGIVAIQGDRILFDVSSMTVPFDEQCNWQLPRGPFLLSLIARCEIHPVFIIRMGYRRYRIEAWPPLAVNARHAGGKETAQAEAAAEWSKVLRSVIQRHWQQWFVLEPAFQSPGMEERK